MKKTIILGVLPMIFAANVQAVEIKEGALYCVSSKKIVAYYDYIEKNMDKFAKKLMDRSDCFIKGKNEEAILRSTQKHYVKLELLSGFSIWTKEENITR